MKKEKKVLELFFNEPSKHWHFEMIIKAAKLSRPQASLWLKKFIKEGLIKKMKSKGKMPYYLGNHEHPNYQTKKRLFMLDEMSRSGFLQHLVTLPKASTVILFGSMSRWDWYAESDIDIFIYGDTEGMELGKYQFKLHREIQLFTAKTKKDFEKFGPGLLRNILEGYLVKGTLNFVEVMAHV
ncbi:nucleotidyltransferase domain-containing protein [Candidatus Woesearchaeota archaeon]|nr:nucleotidyltransferase domain-containing protein [Candidatus Woesearchaeota archaeon]